MKMKNMYGKQVRGIERSTSSSIARQAAAECAALRFSHVTEVLEFCSIAVDSCRIHSRVSCRAILFAASENRCRCPNRLQASTLPPPFAGAANESAELKPARVAPATATPVATNAMPVAVPVAREDVAPNARNRAARHLLIWRSSKAGSRGPQRQEGAPGDRPGEAVRAYTKRADARSHSLFRFEEHDVFLPMMTLEELDDHKKA